jgi:hypothetical protein
MNAPAGSAASHPTEPPPPYLQRLAQRQAEADVRRQSAYGLILGWILTLVPGFLYFCVPSRLDWLWSALAILGLFHLAAAVLLPQLLAWPERAWMGIARLQGGLIMAVLLTLVYYAMIWPVGLLSRRRAAKPFFAWSKAPPEERSAWRPIDLTEVESGKAAQGRMRSVPVLLAGVLAVFVRQGRYLVLPVLLLLLLLGLVLFFVQSSALAPFIYNLF